MATTVADLPGRWTYLRDPTMKLRTVNGGWESQLAFETDFSNLSAFVLAIAGTPQTITTTWGSMSRIVPLQHPLFSGLQAIQIDEDSCGTASTTSTALEDLYSHAKVYVNFRSVLYGT